MLFTGRFLNAIIVLTVALSAVSLAFYILKRWQNAAQELRFFGLFWLFTALLWVSVTCRSLSAALNNYPLDQIFFKVAQINVFISAAFLGAYVFEKVFHVKTWTNIVFVFYSILAALGTFFTITRSIAPIDLENFFATEYDPSPEAQVIFLTAIIPIIVLLMIDILQRWRVILARKNETRSGLLASVSVLTYLMLGYFDQSGIIGWPVLLIRLLYIGAFATAYMSTMNVLKNDELIYDNKTT
ncbi:MAG: hypothetical protein A3C84_01800 [Candidatus Ryanbacteria bacterium RIFCSPHIGHO2_02_FULL_48_12]|uniref:Histidine kinase N-terminal 7TM region domain-containing protein n=1 Tax=Candidatus Ryanbacteria bacterium RIFCSPHIGHO2_01_FULL_48_27 TaxID=1802115 RepID=A0A1G2G7K0_9BACT|nr:MAG: hypothetical protein A2756_06535 [Candidatus Ryanbacteria bacterium RIFCSPHIGHO2_01_FULL_48_27]OGZ49211.1 MAG: hypothetical protein A3C84_01800 [Candidatus Ryanbacteria bacterium RIFCSPHIGHO2_02_FULL_48_12]